MRRAIYTFFDLLAGLLIGAVSKAPKIIQVPVLIIAFVPMGLLAVIADWQGWKSEDLS